jgi:GDP-4-dehydro-6-deoxy-D-mannose reductase
MSFIVVTGINGFVGQHLARELYKQGFKVIGAGREPTVVPELEPIVHKYYECDLLNDVDVANLPLNKSTAVINLAGLAQVGSSYSQEKLYMDVNVKVQTNIANYLKETNNTSTRIIAVSTGAVYDSSQPMPLAENSKIITEGSPYALSKVAMEEALQEYVDQGIDIVIARPFNHIGPGQLGGFLVPDLALQIQDSDTIEVGNLNTKRDYTDVRDVVCAYVMLATKQNLKHRLYNICSGKSISGKEVMELIKFGLNKNDLVTIVDPKKIRPNDPLVICGSNETLHEDTGWKPTYSLETTISDYIKQFKKSIAK